MSAGSEAAGTAAARRRGWFERKGVARKLAYALAAAACISGVATYATITSSLPFAADPDPDTVIVLLVADLTLLLLLGAVVARRIVQVWADRRRGSAGSRLHVRLVMMFSLLAVTPAIVVAVFSVLFLNFGVQAWFGERVRVALRESLSVAQAYLDEHQQTIRADILAMAYDISRENPLYLQDPVLLGQLLRAHAAVRSLPEAMIFDEGRGILARTDLSFGLEFDRVQDWAMERARLGDVAIMTNETGDRVRALVRLDPGVAVYLYVGRYVEASVINHVSRTTEAVEEYEKLEGRRSNLQISFVMMFAVLSLLLLLAAIWIGLMVATRLVRPVGGLIAAAEQVGRGDLAARVPESRDDDEIGLLSHAFNRMTRQLQSQQGELVEANRQLDARRRFTEAVLGGVSAGVVGLDREGRINLPNRSASRLLSTDIEGRIGEEIAVVAPELAPLMQEVARRPVDFVEDQVKLVRERRTLTLLVRVTAEREGEEIRGYVVTFDDISELLSAQRKAAWADVARRIAHEIKNPLTPIQLSAERLKRKYLKEITSDPETFVTCTDTIVRQVGDIGRMVDEFSAFARMPAPVMRGENLIDLCRQAIFLQATGNPDIRYETDLPQGPVEARCDARQIGQALTNLLQNAADSIKGRREAAEEGEEAPPGRISLKLAPDGERFVISISDNGRGLPHEMRDRLTEPYVTTRAKGTGLGLAIVKKIMEDHSGDLVLEDREGGGAVVRLVLPAQSPPSAQMSPVDSSGHSLNPAHGS